MKFCQKNKFREIYNRLPDRFPPLASLYTRDFNRHIRNHAESKIKTLKVELNVTDE